MPRQKYSYKKIPLLNRIAYISLVFLIVLIPLYVLVSLQPSDWLFNFGSNPEILNFETVKNNFQYNQLPKNKCPICPIPVSVKPIERINDAKYNISINWNNVKGAASYTVYKIVGEEKITLAQVNASKTTYFDTNDMKGYLFNYPVSYLVEPYANRCSTVTCSFTPVSWNNKF